MPIEIVTTEAGTAAIVAGRWPFAEMRRAQAEGRAALDAALEGRSAGPRLTVWRTPKDGLMDYAPGVMVEADFSPSGAVSLWHVPDGRAAHLRHVGGYEGLPGAWQALFSACAAQGLEPIGPNWEIYHDVEGADAVVDLYALLSVRGAAPSR